MKEFQLEKELDIILITFNRKHKLELIVGDILSENSPIKNCSVTFLDNCSTDETSQFLEELTKKYKNIRHIRHKRNIGGNANIVRAMETVSRQKKYFWILCDDDRLDFTYWKDIQEALESNKYDIIQTHSNPMVFLGESYDDKLSKLIVENVLLPAGIYKTNNITDDVISISYVYIYSLIPHMALIAHIINENKKVYFCNFNEQILIQGYSGIGYTRGNKKPIKIMNDMDLSVGFAIALSLINDKILVSKCVDRMRSYLGMTFQGFIKEMPYYWIKAGLYDNLMTVYDRCDDKQKQIFIEILMDIRLKFKQEEANRNISKILQENCDKVANLIIFSKLNALNYFKFSFLELYIRTKRKIKQFQIFAISKYEHYFRVTICGIHITIKLKNRN